MQLWQARHQADEEQNKKLLLRLIHQKTQDVNQMADNVHKQVFDRIDCLHCANCCKSIPPIMNASDIRRISRYLKLSEAKFDQKYLRIDEDGDRVINQSPCPFLESDNKCRIYAVRPGACREYPHTDNRQFVKNIRIHLPNSHYCPAVYHILVELNRQFKIDNP